MKPNLGLALLLSLVLWALIVLSINCANDLVLWSHSKVENSKALAMMDSVANNLRTLVDVEKLMKVYTYNNQKFLWNYTPTIETVFRENLTGNCQFAAVLGKWALDVIGRPARLVSIYRGDDYHAIAVTNDNAIFISNGDVVYVQNASNYREWVLKWFTPSYTNWHEGILKEAVR